MKTILRCEKCSEFTMKESYSCGGKALTPKPAKFSIEDKYGSYRRKAKLEIFKKKGII